MDLVCTRCRSLNTEVLFGFTCVSAEGCATTSGMLLWGPGASGQQGLSNTLTGSDKECTVECC